MHFIITRKTTLVDYCFHVSKNSLNSFQMSVGRSAHIPTTAAKLRRVAVVTYVRQPAKLLNIRSRFGCGKYRVITDLRHVAKHGLPEHQVVFRWWSVGLYLKNTKHPVR